jgi:hypothetical protein
LSLLSIKGQIAEDVQGLMLLQDVSSANCRTLLNQLQSKLQPRQFVSVTCCPGIVGGAFLLLLQLNPHQRVCLAGSVGLGHPVKHE